MSRAARGDRAAIEEVFRVLQPLVAEFCPRLLRDRAAAEDAAQRALVKLFESAHRFDAAGDVVAWALTLATWECRSILRRPRRFEPLTPAIPSDVSVDDDVMRRELEGEAVRLLGALSAADRDTLARAFGPNAEVDLASVAFRKRKQRALQRLRDAWRSKHGEE